MQRVILDDINAKQSLAGGRVIEEREATLYLKKTESRIITAPFASQLYLKLKEQKKEKQAKAPVPTARKKPAGSKRVSEQIVDQLGCLSELRFF